MCNAGTPRIPQEEINGFRKVCKNEGDDSRRCRRIIGQLLYDIGCLTVEKRELKEKYEQYTKGKATYYHDIWCNASRQKPVGEGGCSCTLGKKLKHFQAENEQLCNLIGEVLDEAAQVKQDYKTDADLKAKNARLTNMLEDVVNELDLSEIAIEKHGPLGTPPAELVKEVLAEKDRKIIILKQGFHEIALKGE